MNLSENASKSAWGETRLYFASFGCLRSILLRLSRLLLLIELLDKSALV
jgi:hypothetical protein